MPRDIDVGQTVDERFRIDDVICRGGMACVFKATDMTTGSTVALKAPYFRYECDPSFYARFQREEQIGVTLRHPGILRVHSIPEKSRPYIVMEFLEGKTLDRILGEHSPLPVARALELTRSICDAVAHMHEKNVCHRDLKPQNIMACNDGTLRVMDFGISKVTGLRGITMAGFSHAMGTAEYMAPEQVRKKSGDERTDIYSIGAILYEMLTGATLFQGDIDFIMNARVYGDPVAPRIRNSAICPKVEEIVLRCLARNPDDRYPNLKVLRADLDAPERVEITGRAKNLQAPVLPKYRVLGALILPMLVPIVLLVLILLFRKH